MPMCSIKSSFIVKGYKHGNIYYITQNDRGRYNIYQLICLNSLKDNLTYINNMLPGLLKQGVLESEVVLPFPNERHPGFLFMYNVSFFQMNAFRLALKRRERVHIPPFWCV
jgi:hypothetical protein